MKPTPTQREVLEIMRVQKAKIGQPFGQRYYIYREDQAFRRVRDVTVDSLKSKGLISGGDTLNTAPYVLTDAGRATIAERTGK